MSNKIRAIKRAANKDETLDFEALAAKAKAEREKKCFDAVSKVLDEHKCRMRIVVQLGNQAVLLESILKLPAQLLITSQ